MSVFLACGNFYLFLVLMLDNNSSPLPGKINGEKEIEMELQDPVKFPASVSPYSGHKQVNLEEGEMMGKKTQMPPASVMTRLILIMVWRKLIRNPNTYSSLLGLIWSLISFRSEHITSLWDRRCSFSFLDTLT